MSNLLDDFNLDNLADEIQKDLKRTNYWQPKPEVKNTIRVLPPLTKKFGEKLFYYKHRTHWIDGKPRECLNQTFTDNEGNFHEAEPCPACIKAKKLRKISTSKDSPEGKLASQLSARDRYVLRIVSKDGSGGESQPIFYEVGPKIFTKISSAITSGEFGSIVHPVEGRDIIIIKKGSGLTTNYDESYISPNISPIFNDKNKLIEVLKNAYEMSYTQTINFVSAEEMEQDIRIFLEGESSSGKSEYNQTTTTIGDPNSSLESLGIKRSGDVPEELNLEDDLNNVLEGLDLSSI